MGESLRGAALGHDPAGTSQRQLAADGKRQRGSRRRVTGEDGRRTTKMDQTLNVWCIEQGITLARRRILQDGSEIEQLPLLLLHLYLKGAVVTADAAHAQRHTAEVIIEGGGPHVLCVKGNQPTTRAALEQGS